MSRMQQSGKALQPRALLPLKTGYHSCHDGLSFLWQATDHHAALVHCREALSIHPDSAFLRDLEVGNATSLHSKQYYVGQTW